MYGASWSVIWYTLANDQQSDHLAHWCLEPMLYPGSHAPATPSLVAARTCLHWLTPITTLRHHGAGAGRCSGL